MPKRLAVAAGLLALAIALYLAYVYLWPADWHDDSNFNVYQRTMQERLQQRPQHLDASSGMCDASMSCAYMPFKVCQADGVAYKTRNVDQSDLGGGDGKPLRAFATKEKCGDWADGHSSFLHGTHLCANMNEVYCGSTDWASSFRNNEMLPWMTSSAGVVAVAGYGKGGEKATDAFYVPFDADKDLFSDCADQKLKDLLKLLNAHQQQLPEVATAIVAIINVVAPGAGDAKAIGAGLQTALKAFGAFVDAYEPAKMDVYSCSTKTIVASKGADSGGAVAWIGNVRDELRKALDAVTGGRVKSIDQLERQQIVAAWQKAFPKVDGKSSVLLHYFENASIEAVRRLTTLLLGPGPDYTQNDGADTAKHFGLANQVCSLGVQATDDATILAAATAWLESLCHHDR